MAAAELLAMHRAYQVTHRRADYPAIQNRHASLMGEAFNLSRHRDI